jgi:1,4-alpha-glucan branching enzyme
MKQPAGELPDEIRPGFRKAKAASNKSAARQDEAKASKPTQFCVEAPLAHSVKLVADFTNWEKSPLKLKRDENGKWQASVPLAPGRYEYRFIVNEEWCDDPHCEQRVPNPFGGMNAVVEVQ